MFFVMLKSDLKYIESIIIRKKGLTFFKIPRVNLGGGGGGYWPNWSKAKFLKTFF